MALSDRRTAILANMDEHAASRAKWVDNNQFTYAEHHQYMRFLVPEGSRVLDMSADLGDLLAELKPSFGLGVNLSQALTEQAINRHQNAQLQFVSGDVENLEFLQSLQRDEPYDVIILSNTLTELDDCMELLQHLQSLCTAQTRIVIASYSHLWEPIYKLGTKLGMRMPSGNHYNWLGSRDIDNLLALTGYQPIKREWRQLMPKLMLGLGWLLNRYFAMIPGLRRFCCRQYIVARPTETGTLPAEPSTSVIIPCRNEKGNVEAAIQRLPKFCKDLEVIFVEGHSQDGTWDEIQRVQAAYPDWNIVSLQQPGKGKGDAVRAAFDVASKDILMILDADLTVPPEDLPKFYRAMATGKGEFINGSRFVYVQEDEAMRFLNYWANRTFALIFSYLLNQTFTDTLCGTKVLTKDHYNAIAANRHYFGDFDPFGDFDLIFGAAKLNLKMVEVPIHYASRTYGSTQISRFSHGWLLLKMAVFALFKLKIKV